MAPSSRDEHPALEQKKQQHLTKQRIVELAEGDNPSEYEDKHLYECVECLRGLNESMKKEQIRLERSKGIIK